MSQCNSCDTVPPEIVDMVIHNLRSDRGSLSACSLVCRSWLPASYYHLFHSVALRRSNFGGFLALLCSPCCASPPFIRDLTIEDIFWKTSTDYNSHRFHILVGFDLITGPIWALDDVVPYLRKLTSISSLRLNSGNWSEVDHQSRAAFLACFTTLTKLSITRMEFKVFDDVVETISGFSLLESLHLDNVGWSNYSEGDEFGSVSTDSPPPPPPQLRHLGLGYCYKRDVLYWLLRHQPTPAVSSVDLGTIFGLNTPSIGSYLRALSSTLEHLRMGFCGLDAGGDAEEFHREVDLKYNTALRSIRIDHLISYSDYQFTSSVPWIVPILSQISSPYLEEVAFSVWLTEVGRLEPEDFPVDWCTFDDLFSQCPKFQHLQRLRFWIIGDVERLDVEREIRGKLPRCAESGILSFG